jgi:hypothetical protein
VLGCGCLHSYQRTAAQLLQSICAHWSVFENVARCCDNGSGVEDEFRVEKRTAALATAALINMAKELFGICRPEGWIGAKSLRRFGRRTSVDEMIELVARPLRQIELRTGD